jgi:hypothetical protein
MDGEPEAGAARVHRFRRERKHGCTGQANAAHCYVGEAHRGSNGGAIAAVSTKSTERDSQSSAATAPIARYLTRRPRKKSGRQAACSSHRSQTDGRAAVGDGGSCQGAEGIAGAADRYRPVASSAGRNRAVQDRHRQRQQLLRQAGQSRGTRFFGLRAKNGRVVSETLVLNFSRDGRRISGHSITLKPVVEGNLEQEAMSRAEFDAD